jgi:hypothetical protein
MSQNENHSESYKVYYHPNKYTHLLKHVFRSLDHASSFIREGHPDYISVNESEVNYPFITVSNGKQPNSETVRLFFCKVQKRIQNGEASRRSEL